MPYTKGYARIASKTNGGGNQSLAFPFRLNLDESCIFVRSNHSLSGTESRCSLYPWPTPTHFVGFGLSDALVLSEQA